MKMLIIIPARYASTRFPGKPLAEIGGKPVIQHVVEKAVAVSNDVYVATDDERIYNKVVALGGKAIMTAATHRSGTDRCFEAYCKITEGKKCPYDVVINIQGDEPFIQPEQIQALADCFENPEVQIATLAKRFETSADIFDPNKVKVVFSAFGKALFFSRSPIPYCRGTEKQNWLTEVDFYKHIGMYAYRPEILKEITDLAPGKLEKAESLEQLRWLENGYNIAVKITGHESIGIDTPADLEKANQIYQK